MPRDEMPTTERKSAGRVLNVCERLVAVLERLGSSEYYRGATPATAEWWNGVAGDSGIGAGNHASLSVVVHALMRRVAGNVAIDAEMRAVAAG